MYPATWVDELVAVFVFLSYFIHFVSGGAGAAGICNEMKQLRAGMEYTHGVECKYYNFLFVYAFAEDHRQQ